ncbi:unnamed protein product [Acanthoscelides obtectus]|uniref:Uncharacterized protein n=1 Tax=Acanthoscelides obtectus TaxID=200917 RepID=A0A9P0LNH1_ACAOB|nr:unnamed protein product [Acanthoscelides obtectus]CAK1675227.1 Odorant receptor 43a [Acanthoscelides obtectus]
MTACTLDTAFDLQSDDISQAFYDANWFSTSRRFRKAMLITMARIQTPLCLTIGRFAPMTLSVSVAVCKASFSYYAVFKSVEEEA